jgi:hypothetical protein
MLEAYIYRLVYSSVSQMDMNEHRCPDVVYRHIILKIHIDSNSLSILWWSHLIVMDVKHKHWSILHIILSLKASCLCVPVFQNWSNFTWKTSKSLNFTKNMLTNGMNWVLLFKVQNVHDKSFKWYLLTVLSELLQIISCWFTCAKLWPLLWSNGLCSMFRGHFILVKVPSVGEGYYAYSLKVGRFLQLVTILGGIFLALVRRRCKSPPPPTPRNLYMFRFMITFALCKSMVGKPHS